MSNLFIRLFLIVLTGFSLITTSRAETVKICSDLNFWYPFTMVEDGKAVGIHIDIVNEALSNLGMNAKFRPLPWKRCLNEAKVGSVDAIATASYKTDRAEYLHYPEDASTATKSKFRVAQVEYVVVTTADNPYEFNGDIHSLPEPVRAPRGWSIVSDLTNQGINVDSQAAGDEVNIKKLLRQGKGSLVTIPDVVQELEKRPEYQGKLKVSSTPIKSKSYFLPFSKKTKISKEHIEKIWAEIAKIRDNPEKMAAIASKY